MTGSAHVNYTMAGLLAVGGVAGFAKAKSVPSLVAGLAVGSLFALSAFAAPFSGNLESPH